MRVLDTTFARGFIRMADDGWRQGWHECHGGNLSYRLAKEEVKAVEDDLRRERGWTPLSVQAGELALSGHGQREIYAEYDALSKRFFWDD